MDSDKFLQSKSIGDLAAEQVTRVVEVDSLGGVIADEELDEFVAAIYRARGAPHPLP